MLRLPNDLLDRLRTLPQALADLAAKYDEMHLNHPERGDVARMIQQLEAEVARRTSEVAAG